MVVTMTSPAPLSSPAAGVSRTDSDPVQPNVDWWEVGGTRYETTDELIRNFHPNPDGSSQGATYHWRQETTPPPPP
ncbi:MAG: hypothetical protein AB1758_27610, partial [Candidatus Eremiobacterota bacterium]